MHDPMWVPRRERPTGDRRGSGRAAPLARDQSGAVRRARLVVGPADDPYEREADLVADLAIGRRSAAPAGVGAATRIRRTSAGGAASSVRAETGRSAGGPFGSETRIRRTAVVGPEGGTLDPATEGSIAAARGGGSRIVRGDAQHLSDTIGADVSRVRLHAGPRAAALNDRLQATAFTIGHDVFFRDGLPDTGTTAGMHLLAHEVAHTVQGGDSPIGRRILRRRLIPKVADAFQVAAKANRERFRDGRDATDVYASVDAQEELSRVHGRMHMGQDSPDAQQIARIVRAVVLTEYAVRVRNLLTAVDDKGRRLSPEVRAAKEKTYRAKADQSREKNLPLIAKGSQAPETRGFIATYGLEAAFRQGANVARPPGVARIDVRTSAVGAGVLGMQIRSHLFIVYTTKEGKQLYFRGGPDRNVDFTIAAMGEYRADTVDWDPSAPSVTLLEGPAAEAKLDALVEATSVIDRMRVKYLATTSKAYGGNKPNPAQKGVNAVGDLVSSDGENCNAVAWTILSRAGVAPKKPSGHHPGWGSILGSKTVGKQDALPPAELSGPAKEYTVDASRDLADEGGAVQVFRDRGFFDPIAAIAVGTGVQVYAESATWRQIRYEGTFGFIPRRSEDAVYDSLPRWVEALRAKHTDLELTALIAPRNEPLLAHLAMQTNIPIEHLDEAIAATLHREGTAAALIAHRIALLGESRAREMLDNPRELGRLAGNLHVTTAELAGVAETLVRRTEQEAFVGKVRTGLRLRLGDDNAANLAANEAPDYPTLHTIASEMAIGLDRLLPVVEQLRPAANRGQRLEQLLAGNEYAQGDLPQVAAHLLEEWVARTGAAPGFLLARCAKVHEAGVFSRERRQAEATARAEAQVETLTANVTSARALKQRAEAGARRPKSKGKGKGKGKGGRRPPTPRRGAAARCRSSTPMSPARSSPRWRTSLRTTRRSGSWRTMCQSGRTCTRWRRSTGCGSRRSSS